MRRFGPLSGYLSFTGRRSPQDHSKPCIEPLEGRTLLSAAYALIGEAGTTLVRFDTTNPGVIQDAVSISGLQPGETLQGIDFRPTTGVLYALGVVNPDAGTDT